MTWEKAWATSLMVVSFLSFLGAGFLAPARKMYFEDFMQIALYCALLACGLLLFRLLNKLEKK